MKPFLFCLVISLTWIAGALAAAPLTFEEISLLLRTGELPQNIVAEAGRRKLLRALSPAQEAALRGMGAQPGLLTALNAPALLMPKEEAAVYEAKMQARASVPAPAPVVPNNGAPAVPPPPSNPNAPNPFTEAIVAARQRTSLTLQLNNAFRISELEQAQRKARQERKLLGFIMVWDQFFGRPFSSNGTGSAPGLTHFFQAFNPTMVLVFVRHEDELPLVPAAVKKGFEGPDEGGFAPNMAVTDATATEFIVEIPLGGGKAGLKEREANFQAGSIRMSQWLATHPAAVAF